MSDRRCFEWWCPNCNTLLRLETSENANDDARDVDCCGCYTDMTCPMCEKEMWSADEAIARNPELKTLGWEPFKNWRLKKAK